MDPSSRADLCQPHASFCHALADANRLPIDQASRALMRDHIRHQTEPIAPAGVGS